MTISIALAGFIVLITNLIARIIFYGFGNRDSRNNNAGLIILVLTLVSIILSPIIAEIIKLSISRTREYLADSSAALLTRYPEGLARALEKIKNANLRMENANLTAAPLFISNPFGPKIEKRKNILQKLFSTHPPIDERIARLRSMGI